MLDIIMHLRYIVTVVLFFIIFFFCLFEMRIEFVDIVFLRDSTGIEINNLNT